MHCSLNYSYRSPPFASKISSIRCTFYTVTYNPGRRERQDVKSGVSARLPESASDNQGNAEAISKYIVSCFSRSDIGEV
ncbi:hypothetical protein EYF80_059106 [Liparis tanakae]|uniref:Uncharacterized protein n=1 Tax=Liparis tanakae TaxID=230148 RepID=A0A4Z2ER24_9TELE|nr:hypothetical protein EYF80_059106 [Liparis tanakae]